MIRKGITKVLISVFAALLCVMPFSLRTFAEEHNDLGYIAIEKFFEPYGFYTAPDQYQLSCTSGSSSNGYCSVYTYFSSVTIPDIDLFNVMTVHYTNGTSDLNVPTAYTTSNRFRTTKEPLYLVFLSTTNITSSNIHVYPQSGYTVTGERVTTDNQTVMTPNGYYLVTLKFVATSYPSSGTVWTTLSMPLTNSTLIIPLYKGSEASMSDDIHRVVFGTGQKYNVSDPDVVAAINAMNSNITTKADELYEITERAGDYAYGILRIMNEVTNPRLQNIYNILNQGDQYTSPSVNSNDDQNSDLSTSIDNLVDQEDDFNNDMQQNLNNINFQGSDQFLQTGMLSTSAHWVKTQYNRMVSGNVIGSLISYALLFGLGILIVGKMR